LLQDQALVFLSGTVDRQRERPSIVLRDVVPLETALEKLTASVLVRLGGAAPPPLPGVSPPGSQEELLVQLSDILAKHKGVCPVYIQLRPLGRSDLRATIRADRQWYVTPSRPLIEELEKLLGDQDKIALSPRPPAPAEGNGNRYGNKYRGGNGNGNGNGS
jgi:hypothetical protein